MTRHRVECHHLEISMTTKGRLSANFGSHSVLGWKSRNCKNTERSLGSPRLFFCHACFEGGGEVGEAQPGSDALEEVELWQRIDKKVPGCYDTEVIAHVSGLGVTKRGRGKENVIIDHY